ncbi:MAG: MFS transporter [Candidatus Abyssobacteria bacterium SURF_5]|uniref:MFS transporter n=1 Tax=Abyssobacteria bacterium (strain SURF_5) TaxID=2093360 RepID=A0A3A4N5M5_ABYX5|nr:MAG: MFS transporter [Candidatus Abyssubacteria bacterium SURF_5]
MALIGVGWFGLTFFWGLHTGPMPLFLKTFTDSKFNIAMVLSLAGVSGCIVPPIVGYISDRSRSRYGRRRPYIFMGSIGVLLCILSLPYAHAFWLVAVLCGTTYFSLRFSETPYLSLLPDVTPPEQRSTASGIMNLFGSVALISFFVISFSLWEKYPNMVFRLVAVVCFGALLLAISLLAEPGIAARSSSASRPSVIGYLRNIIKEGNAVGFFFAQFFWWLGFWMVSAFATLFAVEELRIPEGEAFLVLVAFAIVATLFVVPLGMMGDRFGRKGILSLMVALWAVTELLVGFSQNLTQAVILVGLTAIPYAAVMGVGYAFFLDLIPRERTAEFVGFSIISIATSQIIGPLVGGKIIDTLGYRSLFPVTAAFMVVGLVLLQFIRPRRAVEAMPVPDQA